MQINGQFLEILFLYMFLYSLEVFCTGLFWWKHPKMANLLPSQATNA